MHRTAIGGLAGDSTAVGENEALPTRRASKRRRSHASTNFYQLTRSTFGVGEAALESCPDLLSRIAAHADAQSENCVLVHSFPLTTG